MNKLTLFSVAKPPFRFVAILKATLLQLGTQLKLLSVGERKWSRLQPKLAAGNEVTDSRKRNESNSAKRKLGLDEDDVALELLTTAT